MTYSQNSARQTTVARLVVKEPSETDVQSLSPLNVSDEGFELSDVVCIGLEEMSRHLRRLDEDFQSGRFDRIEARARHIVLLADQMGLRRIGQVAADVIYCTDDGNEVALAATLSRLMRLMSQALDHAAGPLLPV